MNMLPLVLLALKNRLRAEQTVPAFAVSNTSAGTPESAAASSINSDPLTAAPGVLCGYWFEWEPRVALRDIPKAYNHVCVAFLEHDEVPAFTPYFYSRQDIIDGISALKAEGREVLISMGGASGRITLTENDKTIFKNGLFAIVDSYGFTGVDIDLEGESVRAGANGAVIPAVLREMKDYYRSKGKKFLITMAPEFRYLRGYDAGYKPYVEDLNGYYDMVWPQYYNQGADGIWSVELNRYLSQDDDAYKADFLYTLTRAIVTGTQDFIKIPADKFAIGLPASPASALNGYVKNPADVRRALSRLKTEGSPIRGLMTWSINQDSANGYEFVNRYAPYVT